MLSQRNHKPGERLTESVNCLSWDCGTRNLCYCLLEDCNEPDKEFSIRLWENFSLRSETTAEAIFNLQAELDARPWMLHADHVVIEAQCNPNTTMKVISHAIQMYFAAKRKPVLVQETDAGGSLVRRSVKPQQQSIHFISPKNKFKVCNVPEPEGCSGHAKNKKIAVLMAKKLLGQLQDKSMFDYLMSHRKKDDLSDSFLQGLYFLRLIRQRSKASKKILDHIHGKSELSIIEEDDGDAPRHEVYQGENFTVPSFDIDGNSVSRGVIFEKKTDCKFNLESDARENDQASV